MKKIIFFLSFVFVSKSVHTQPVVTELVDFGFGQSYNLYKFIDSDETGFYISSSRNDSKPRGYYIEKRNKQTGKIMFVIKLNHKPLYSYCIGDKIVAVYSELDTKTSIRNLSCGIFSSVNGSKIKDKELETIDNQELGPYKYDYLILQSPDKSKLLMIPNNIEIGVPNKKSEKKTAKMYDSKTMDLIWELSDNVHLSYNSLIDNKGNILWPTINGVAVVRFKSDKQRDIIGAMKEPQMLSTASIHFTEDGQAVMLGVFKERGVGPNAENKGGFVNEKDIKYGKAGFYYSKINLTELKFENEKIENFIPEIEQKLTWQDKGKFIGKTPAEKQYNAIDIIEENGAIYFICEHFFEGFYEASSNAEDGSHINNQYKEVIVSKFSSTGKVEWTRILPRSTIGKAGNLHIASSNEGLNFIYLDIKNNDKYNNLDIYIPEKLTQVARLDKTNAVCVTVDKNGGATKKELTIPNGFFLYPREKSLMLDKKTLLIYLIMEEQTKLATVTFN